MAVYVDAVQKLTSSSRQTLKKGGPNISVRVQYLILYVGLFEVRNELCYNIL